jgi:hypothetical protein
MPPHSPPQTRSASTSPSSAEQLSVSSHTSFLEGTPPLLELLLLQDLSPLQAGADLLPLVSPPLPIQLRSSSSGFSADVVSPSPLVESKLQMQAEDYFTNLLSSPLSPVSFL